MRKLTSAQVKKSSLAPLLLTTTLALGSLGLSAAAWAADSSDTSGGGSACCSTLTAAINNMSSSITNAIYTGFSVLTTQINTLVVAGVDFSSTLASNTAYQTVITNNWVNTDATNYGKAAAKQAFQASSANANASMAQYSAIVASTTGASTQSTSTTTASTSNPPNLSNFTMSTLMGNSVLTSDQITSAQSYIQFMSGMVNPIQTLPASVATLPTGPVRSYMTALGSYVAAQSVGQGVLYKALAARTVEPGLGPTANLPDNISPLKLQETMVTTPLTQSWYDSMSKANPADVQKQTLFLLANMQNLMYQNGLQLEQLNVTLASLQLQMLEGLNRENLQKLRGAALNTPAPNA